MHLFVIGKDAQVKVRDYASIKKEEKVIEMYGPEKLFFEWPFLLANGPHGELIVGNNSPSVTHLVVFNEHLQFLQAIGSEGTENGMFQRICGIAIDMNGFLYVTDCLLNCIQKFKMDGRFISKFGMKGIGNGQFNEPFGLTFSKCNLMFVCDRKNHRIQAFQGECYFYKFGRYSIKQEPGTFNQPVDLTFNNNEDKLFISDWGNHRVQIFEPNGQFLAKIENSFDIPFRIQNPDGIFFTKDGHLLVSSTECILIFKEEGLFVSAIEGRHSDGTERFKDCIGVIMMNNGKIVVSDGLEGTNRLIIF